jgi:hypothetical protein
MNNLPAAAVSDVPKYAVSEISGAVRRTLEGNLGRVPRAQRDGGDRTDPSHVSAQFLQPRIGGACRAGARQHEPALFVIRGAD